MAHALEFEFLDDAAGGTLVPVGGPIAQIRSLLARGDLDTAVQLYEESRGACREDLLQEVPVASLELKRSIAGMFKRARDFAAAGVAFEALRADAEAASCFEQVNEHARAGEAWKRARELAKAAAAFERAGRIDDAVALYGQAGSKDQMAECLARACRFEAAAAVYRSLDNLHAEVESLKACVAAAPAEMGPTLRLAELMGAHGHPDRAAELMMGCVRVSEAARADTKFLTVLAALLEASNNPAAASKVRARIPQTVSKEAKPVPQLRATMPLPTTPGGDAYGFLKALPMFAELSMDDMRALFRICVQHGFGPGMHLIEPNQPGRGLFIIVDGVVEVFVGHGGEQKLINTLGAGGYAGEISLLLDAPTSARVTAKSNVKALFISREAFRQYVMNTPSAALRIYRLFSTNLAERVRTLSSR